jgi:hypothetical protein
MNEFEKWKSHFIGNRQLSLISFYEPILGNYHEAVVLVERCRDLQNDRRPLWIMNSIERLGRLSQEMAASGPTRTAFAVLLLLVCIETIYSQAKVGPSEKVKIIIDFFERYILPEDSKKLLRGIQRSAADSLWLKRGQKLSLKIVARLVNELRNLFAHEGIDWEFSFADGDGWPLQNLVGLNEGDEKQKTEHSYDVTLTLAEFQVIVLRGCTNFLQEMYKSVAR